jgi:putative membrane protein
MAVGWIELLVGLLVLMLFLVLAAGAVVVAIWYARRGEGGSGIGGPPVPSPGVLATDEDALEILRRRYARGEITREEYLQIRQDLMD